MSAEEVANAFVQHYYNTFDNNRAALASLYVRHNVATPAPPSFLCLRSFDGFLSFMRMCTH